MKYVVLLPLVLCGLALKSNAQNAGPDIPPQFSQVTKVRFGAKVGLNLSNTDFNKGYPTPPAPVATTWQPGIAIGFLLQVPVSKVLSLQQEYLFSQMNGKIRDSGTEFKLSYLSLPLLLKYSFLSRFALMAGPQVDLLIQAEQKANGVSSDITHDTEERSIGAAAGVEYYVFKNLSLTARYVHGLNHIGIGQRSDVTEFKFESVQVAAEIKF